MKHQLFPNNLKIDKRLRILPLLLAAILVAFAASATPPKKTINFNKTYLGGAMCMFAGKHGGEITLKQAVSETRLSIRGGNPNFKIKHFILVVTNKAGTQKFAGTSADLTPEMLSAIRNAGKGAKIEFMDVKVVYGKRPMPARGVKLTIV